MFNPSQLNDLKTLEDKDLGRLPNSEDDRFEYKSSLTKDGELADKIARAASGFWNSGGGLFVAGVNKHGQPDGGISMVIGRQSRRDWIDQAIAQTRLGATYVVQSIENAGAGFNIQAGNAVYLIGFGESENGPHMAPDNRYYIRAGAHTVPATHFIVEAIHARRGLRTPLLSYVVRSKSTRSGVLQVGVVCMNNAPALDVEVSFDPLPPFLEKISYKRFPINVPVISDQFPFFIDCHLMGYGEEHQLIFKLVLKYRDIANRVHQLSFDVDLARQFGPSFGGTSELKDIESALREIARALKN